MFCSATARHGWVSLLAILLVAMACASPAPAAPLSAASRTHLSRGEPVWVIVEFAATAADQAAQMERLRRNLVHDDRAILQLRSQGYRAVKAQVEQTATGKDVLGIIDYSHFPLSAWHISSLDALARLQSMPSVLMVHENAVVHPVSVSDLSFINQPQAALAGATGAGTTIAVIDGGLGSNYLNYSDFGTCTGVNTPASTCRVVYNQDFYSGSQASTETAHGTNVSAIALGVAPAAKLAMFDVFNGSNASNADLLTAMNSAITLQATYNIVAINLSLGDGSSHSAQCSTHNSFVSAVKNLESAGITTVVAAGNSGSKSGLGEPACTPGVVSVGAVYDASYGSVSWVAAADSGGTCTDASAPDMVTCFSQSASYLSILAPGTFVNAPSSSFQETGTSQATPHIAGAVAALRALYPSEPLLSTLQRLQITGTQDTDAGNNLTTPRLNLLAATLQGTALVLSGSGPATSTAGTKSTYQLSVVNNGPLLATDVQVTETLPAGATVVTMPSGCAVSSGVLTCSAATLGVGSTLNYSITVSWSGSGPVYATASVDSAQINSATPAQQTLSVGTAPAPESPGGDGPLPLWAYLLLAGGLFAMAQRQHLGAGRLIARR